MKTVPYLCAFILATHALVGDSNNVSYVPKHPLADAMGFVLVGSDAESILPFGPGPETGAPYPYQDGWPVDISNYREDEGGLFVEADGDQEPEILFQTHLTTHLLNHDGTYVAGWPVNVPNGTHTSGQPAFGDLDGDGMGEVVVTSDNWPNGSSGWTHAYHTDGTAVEGFPTLTNGDHSRSPTVVDLDEDGCCEIVVGERDYPIGRVYVFDGGGQLLQGWPQELDHVPASSAGAADIDNDDVREIVYESYSSIYAFEMDGSVVGGFPYTPTTGDVFSYSAPVFADADGDGYLEIAVGGHSLSGTDHMFLLNHDGTDCVGWPTVVGYWIYAPATFADMDGDDDLELLVGDQVLSPTPTNHLFAWHHDGSSVTGWPVGPIEAINAQVSVADLDGDADPEFIWDTNVTPGKLVGYHHTGDPIEDWPITTDGSTFFDTAALDDVDGDGDLELLVLTYLDTPLCTAHLWDVPDQVDPADVQMPMFQYNPGRTGLILDAPPQGTEESALRVSNPVISASPNPFSGSVSVRVAGRASSPGRLRIFDLSGRLVREMEPVLTDNGAVYSWNGRSASGGELPRGVYCAKVRWGGVSSSVMLLKL